MDDSTERAVGETGAAVVAPEREKLLAGLLREAYELADNWPGIAYTADLERRITEAIGPRLYGPETAASETHHGAPETD